MPGSTAGHTLPPLHPWTDHQAAGTSMDTAVMASSILTPWRRRAVAEESTLSGSAEPTKILDWERPALIPLRDLVHVDERSDQLNLLRHAHGVIANSIRPVYSVREDIPVSKIIGRGRGSCSQRLAVLEAVARASGIPTRVRGLLLDGRFWHPRFPHLSGLVPNEVVLAWPEFGLSEGWLSVSELFDNSCGLTRSTAPFTNDAGETLYDALARTAIDWDGT